MTLSGWARFENQDEFEQFRNERADELQRRWQFEQELTSEAPSADGCLPGRCRVCGSDAGFSFARGVDGTVNFREQLSCRGCGLIARQRVIMELLDHAPLPADAKIYLTEQSSLLYNAVRRRWPKSTYGSEYVVGSAMHRLRWWLRHLYRQREWLHHQDVTALGFPDASHDIVISCDVLEHVADYQAALNEIARVLKPGGRLLLTVPFAETAAQTKVRARVRSDGSIEHLEPPEYHGDPINPGGVLAFYNFGWDLLEALRVAGFAEAHWVLPWRPEAGLLGALWTLEARR